MSSAGALIAHEHDEFADLLGEPISVATPLAIARSYIARGWSPIPISHREKGPRLKDWGRLRLQADNVAQHFGTAPKNVGVILGEASGGLVDIDLDCPEARMLAPSLLPATSAIFGRAGNQDSHWIYVAPDLTTAQIHEPGSRKTLVELRSNSSTDQPSQTVFPGSTHETGERVEWRHGLVEPTAYGSAELLTAFHRLGAATILARAFPAEGGRHHATIALFGLLGRLKWDDAKAIGFVKAVRDAAGADKRKSLKNGPRDAAKRLQEAKAVYGLPALRDAFGVAAADRAAELLGYGRAEIDVDSAFDEETVDPDFVHLDEAAAPPLPTTLRFLSPGECAGAPSRGYVIKGFLAPGDVACIYGAPGAGKSLISPHLGYAVAQGRSVFGMRTKPGPVFYVAAEDPAGMRGRVSALKRRHGNADAFTLVEGVSDFLAKPSPDLVALLAAIKERKPSLIFVDTLAMSFPGLEENSADAMGRVVAVARRLAAHGAAIVLIHHDTKAGTPTPRGHSLLNGALDVALQLKARDEDGVVRGSLSKNRNGACDRDIAFRIDTEAMGVDEDGDVITYALVAELNGAVPKGKPKLSLSERAAKAVLIGLVQQASGREVALDDWRSACIEGYEVSAREDRDNRRKATSRAIQGLAQKSVVFIRDGVVSLAGVVGSSVVAEGSNAFEYGDRLE